MTSGISGSGGGFQPPISGPDSGEDKASVDSTETQKSESGDEAGQTAETSSSSLTAGASGISTEAASTLEKPEVTMKTCLGATDKMLSKVGDFSKRVDAHKDKLSRMESTASMKSTTSTTSTTSTSSSIEDFTQGLRGIINSILSALKTLCSTELREQKAEFGKEAKEAKSLIKNTTALLSKYEAVLKDLGIQVREGSEKGLEFVAEGPNKVEEKLVECQGQLSKLEKAFQGESNPSKREGLLLGMNLVRGDLGLNFQDLRQMMVNLNKQSEELGRHS